MARTATPVVMEMSRRFIGHLSLTRGAGSEAPSQVLRRCGLNDGQRPASLPAFSLFGLAAVPGPPRHFELEPRFPGLDRFGAVLDPRAAFFYGASVEAGHLAFLILPL